MVSRNELFNEISLLQSVFENSDAATIILDHSGLICMVNRRLEQITGYTKSHLEGNKKWTDIVIDEEIEELHRYFQLLKANPDEVQERKEVRYTDSTGNIRTGYMSAYTIPEQKLLVLSVVDITDQKENQKELVKAKDNAENSERLKTEFLANMSHEIRTPINSIVGFADLLKIEGLPEEKKELYLNQVIHGSHDLLGLIEKIISVSRLDSNQVKLNRRDFNLNSKLEEIAEKFREELVSRGKGTIELNFQAGSKTNDFEIHGDPLRISEVFTNLLENAIKFTEEGRIEFGYYIVDADASESEDESLLFYVKDSGLGIDKDKKKIIFNRFVKVIEKEETIYKGAGLGLAISSELVKLFGGSIWVESTKGNGSRFFFTYPLSKKKTSKLQSPNTENKVTSSIDWSEKEVLVAEDVESNYLFIKELLLPTNVKLLRARDGKEAVDIFDQNPNIDLVIMDILMPGMDGYEATTEIRKQKPDIPVIAQSAFTFEGDIQNGLYAGCFNDYIMKPYTRKVLMAVINKYFPE